MFIIQGGYQGYYNGHLLRSAYEYVYARILECNNKKYETEWKTYCIDDYLYTPDFFIFNSLNELEEIVEIRGHRLNLDQRIYDTNRLREIINVKVTLLTEVDLRKICRENKLSYDKLKIEWRTSKDTILNNNSGEFNSMYGKHHNEKTIKILSEKAKERMKDEKYFKNITQKMIQWNIDNNYAGARKPRVERVIKKCLCCDKEFEISINSKQKYCSFECSFNSKENKTNLERCTQKNKTIKALRDEEIKKFVLNWVKNNIKLVKQIPFNEIDTYLKEMISEIENKFGVKDWRTITNAVCKSQSRKEFLRYIIKEIN